MATVIEHDEKNNNINNTIVIHAQQRIRIWVSICRKFWRHVFENVFQEVDLEYISHLIIYLNGLFDVLRGKDW